MAIDDLASTLDSGNGEPATGTVVSAEDVTVFRWSKALRQRVVLLQDIDWKVNRGEHDDVPAEFMKWVRGGGRVLPGLIRRRREESLFYSVL